MFEIDGKMYELKYNIKTIEQIEAVTGDGIVSAIRKNDGILSVTNLKAYFGFALYNADGNRVSPQQGVEMAVSVMENEGFIKANQMVVTAIDRDCPFLFKVG